MTHLEYHSRRYDAALWLFRLAVGAVFIAHGGQKLFEMGFDQVTGGFQQMGIPYPDIAARVVSLVEFFGGILLFIGLFTRLAGAVLMLDMLGAILLVHLPNGFFLPNGYEYAMTLAVANLAFVVAGAGVYSLDAWLKGRRHVWAPAPAEMPITVTRHA